MPSQVKSEKLSVNGGQGHMMTEHAVGLCAEFSTGRREGIKGEDPEKGVGRPAC